MKMQLTTLCLLPSLLAVAAMDDEPTNGWGFWKSSGPLGRSAEQEIEHEASYLEQQEQRSNLRGLGSFFGGDETEVPKVVGLIESVACEPDHSKAVEFVTTFGDVNAGNAACATDGDPDSCGGGCCRFGAFFICDEENRMAHLPCVCNRNTNDPNDYVATFTEPARDKSGEVTTADEPGMLTNLMNSIVGESSEAPKSGDMKEEFEKNKKEAEAEIEEEDDSTDETASNATKATGNKTKVTEVTEIGVDAGPEEEEVVGNTTETPEEEGNFFGDILGLVGLKGDEEKPAEAATNSSEADKSFGIEALALPTLFGNATEESKEEDKDLVDMLGGGFVAAEPRSGNETEESKEEDKDLIDMLGGGFVAVEPRSGNETESETKNETKIEEDDTGSEVEGDDEEDKKEEDNILDIMDLFAGDNSTADEAKEEAKTAANSTTADDEPEYGGGLLGLLGIGGDEVEATVNKQEEKSGKSNATEGGGASGEKDGLLDSMKSADNSTEGGSVGGEGSRKAAGSNEKGMFDWMTKSGDNSTDAGEALLKCGEGEKCGAEKSGNETDTGSAIPDDATDFGDQDKEGEIDESEIEEEKLEEVEKELDQVEKDLAMMVEDLKEKVADSGN